MASNTFYATSNTNSSVSGLLNGGEDSWGRSASAFSVNTLDLGYFTYNMSSIRNTIPKVATISKVTFDIQLKQSRSNTTLYQTSCTTRLYVGSTAKSDEKTSGYVKDEWMAKPFSNNVTITSTELHSQDLKVRYIANYKGTLNVTQYAKDLKCTIDWSPINTTALSINKSSITLNKGSSESLTITRTPSSVSYPTISWSSSNTGVATVDSNGKVTAIGNGTATITAKTTDGTNISKTCSVIVTTPITGITITPSSLSLNVNGTYTLAKNITPTDASNKNVTWTSSNTNVAIVDGNGKVTGIGKGTCNIICTSNENNSIKGSCSVTIIQQATGITINPTSVELEVGSTATITASVTPTTANNRNYTLTSSDTEIAIVNNGVITAIKSGTCTIVATSSDGGHIAKCSVIVINSKILKILEGSVIIQNIIFGTTDIKSAYLGSVQVFKK